MSFINLKTFEPYVEIFAAECSENFGEIYELLAEPVSKLEKKGNVVAHVHVLAPFPTLHKERNYGTAPENTVFIPNHCRPINETFQYASDGDYRRFLIFGDHVRLPAYEPEQWYLHHRERFTIIPPIVYAGALCCYSGTTTGALCLGGQPARA